MQKCILGSTLASPEPRARAREESYTGSRGGDWFVMMQAAKPRGDGGLRVGVVGVGVMGSNHARVFADLPDVHLVGVADPDRDQRDFVSGALDCAAFTDVDALLAHDVHALTIAAPTHLHRELALRCIA